MLQNILEAVPSSMRGTTYGRIVGCKGPLMLAQMPRASLGAICEITHLSQTKLAKIVGFDGNIAKLLPFDDIQNISNNTVVRCQTDSFSLKIPLPNAGDITDCCGQILNAPPNQKKRKSLVLNLDARPPSPLDRRPINSLFPTGVRSIDALCPIGLGQRMAIIAEAGCGKSSLLGMLAQYSQADICVVGLIGERGREVNDFVNECLGEQGLRKSIVVVSTSDESPFKRSMAPYTATAIAEHFRDKGLNVLLLIDSLTRAARAIRDIGLGLGDLPVRQGYTAQVYAELPKLIERAGPGQVGTITACHTLLANGTNDIDPLTEELKSLLDGHIILDPALAVQGLYPAIDITASLSRLMTKLKSPLEQVDINLAKSILHKLKRDRDLAIMSDTVDNELNAALAIEPALRAFLQQSAKHYCSPDSAQNELSQIMSRYKVILSK